MVIRFWFIRETPKARLYSKAPVQEGEQPDEMDLIWIPRSIVEHTTKRGIEHEVDLPDWFIEKNGL